MRFARTATRQVEHKGNLSICNRGKNASIRSCKALRRLSQSRTRYFVLKARLASSGVILFRVLESEVRRGSRLARPPCAVSFAHLREKIICDVPAFSQSERRETELLPPFETQMFVPSKMTLQGDLPTLNVLTIAPRRGSICATELLP